MKENALKLFTENYENKGLCKDLPKFLKSFEKTFKKANTTKTIHYYPWATIERLFRMQGGEIEVVDWAKTIEFKSQDLEPDLETGELVMVEKTTSALFIHLKAKWQGIELDEFYPQFDNQSSRVIRTPSAMDLNTSRQRGSVRLISRISGIGLDIFEQQDDQFGEDGEEKITIQEKEAKQIKELTPKKKTVDTKKEKASAKEAQKKKDKKAEEPVKVETATTAEEPEVADAGFLQTFFDGEKVEPEIKEAVVDQIEKQEAFSDEEFDNDSQEHADMLLEIRKGIRKHNFQAKAKEFLNEKGIDLLSELTYSMLVELNELIKSQE